MIISGLPGIGKNHIYTLSSVRSTPGKTMYDQATLSQMPPMTENRCCSKQNQTICATKILLPPGLKSSFLINEFHDSRSPAGIEAYHGNTPTPQDFAFACNQLSKIIEPLQSRCAILRYNKLADDQGVYRGCWK